MKSVRGLFLSFLVLMVSNFVAPHARAWVRPVGIQGHLFIYTNGEFDIPVIMPALVEVQKNRIRELLVQSLGAHQIHIFSGADYNNGFWGMALRELARQGGNEPIDMMVLTHSSGPDILMPQGDVLLIDTLFREIPESLKPRLRLFLNAGCEGAYAYKDALRTGFKVAAGSLGTSIGNVLIDDFLTQWLQGETVNASAAAINWNCRHSVLWAPIIRAITILKTESYCRSADVTVIERVPGAGELRITDSGVEEISHGRRGD